MLDSKINIVLRILSKVMFTEALDEVLNERTSFFSPCTNISIQITEGHSIFEKNESAFNLETNPKNKNKKNKLRKVSKQSNSKSKERQYSPLITFKVVNQDFKHSILKDSSENALTSEQINEIWLRFGTRPVRFKVNTPVLKQEQNLKQKLPQIRLKKKIKSPYTQQQLVQKERTAAVQEETFTSNSKPLNEYWATQSKNYSYSPQFLLDELKSPVLQSNQKPRTRMAPSRANVRS